MHESTSYLFIFIYVNNKICSRHDIAEILLTLVLNTNKSINNKFIFLYMVLKSWDVALSFEIQIIKESENVGLQQGFILLYKSLLTVQCNWWTYKIQSLPNFPFYILVHVYIITIHCIYFEFFNLDFKWLYIQSIRFWSFSLMTKF